jgi:hypothetical protein
VVQSLMRVPFWGEGRRMQEPAWRNGLTEHDLAAGEARDRSRPALAAIQWRRVVESIWQEASPLAPDRYSELCYERFVSEPLADCFGLTKSSQAHAFLNRRLDLRDMNFQWGDRFGSDEVAMLNDLMGTTLERLGYGLRHEPR